MKIPRMSPSRIAVALTCCLLLASVHSLNADVRIDEKTKFQLAGALGKIVNIFGGKSARDGVTSTVALRGDRKMTFNDTTGQIIDLSEEKVYDLDMKRKSYKVTLFADLRRQMEDAQKRAEASARQQPPGDRPPQAQQDPNQKDIEVDFDIKNTGQTKTMNGFNTHETIVTITVREKDKTIEESGGLIMTSDLWLAPTIAAMKEIGDFDVKYAQVLYGPMVAGASPQDMAAALAMYPMIKPALAKMTAEGGKIEGTPVMTTLTMDAVKSAEQLAEEQKQQQSADQPSSSGGGGLRGRLLDGLANKSQKKDEPQARATFMTTTSEVLKVTTDVGANDVAIPAAFKLSK
jgi:hypothetical protein